MDTQYASFVVSKVYTHPSGSCSSISFFNLTFGISSIPCQ
uniref:Uncharacterized protein n=1 Tax=Moniliophthora roreri TaxID=221103 RepID=A0A0W0FEL0_MONRR